MNQIHIANIFLTQRCNKKCGYCDIVKDYDNMPAEYPSMDYYTKNELTADEWIKIFERILTNNPKCFFILFGGEPFLYGDMLELLKWFHQNDVEYTVITNNSALSRKKIKTIFNAIGALKGLTCSIDPVVYDPSAQGTDVCKKSRDGLKYLVEQKKQGIGEDVVAEVTVGSKSIVYLPRLVKYLSQNDIRSDVTFVDRKKNPYYDFSAVEDDGDLVHKDARNRSILDEILRDKTLKIFAPDQVNELYDKLPSEIRCDIFKDIHNVSMSPDGRFRLCLRIRGVETPKLDIYNVISSNGKIKPSFNKHLKMDYDRYCAGCNWPCIILSTLDPSEFENPKTN